MRIEETELPGLGVRKDFMTASGRRLGVVVHRDGQTDFIVSAPEDPDTCQASVPLSAAEATTLAQLLGGQLIVNQLREEHREVPGIATRQFEIGADSALRDRAMGEAAMRTRTGVSIVAMMREGEVIPSPGPDDVLRQGDLIVAVGTTDGLDAAEKILREG